MTAKKKKKAAPAKTSDKPYRFVEPEPEPKPEPKPAVEYKALGLRPDGIGWVVELVTLSGGAVLRTEDLNRTPVSRDEARDLFRVESFRQGILL